MRLGFPEIPGASTEDRSGRGSCCYTSEEPRPDGRRPGKVGGEKPLGALAEEETAAKAVPVHRAPRGRRARG